MVDNDNLTNAEAEKFYSIFGPRLDEIVELVIKESKDKKDFLLQIMGIQTVLTNKAMEAYNRVP